MLCDGRHVILLSGAAAYAMDRLVACCARDGGWHQRPATPHTARCRHSKTVGHQSSAHSRRLCPAAPRRGRCG